MRTCLPMLIIIFIILPNTASSTTVCPSGCDYSKLSKAVASSRNGDIITVKSGTYADNVVVNKSITIVGEDDVLVLPETGRLPVFYIISTDNVSISNFKIYGKSIVCLEIENSRNVAISDIYLDRCLYGIKITDSSAVSIKNLDMDLPSFGVDIKNSSYVGIDGTTIKSPSTSGVTFADSSTSVFNRVTLVLQGSANGFYLLNSHNSTLSHLSIMGGDTGVVMDSSSSNVIKASEIYESNEGIGILNSNSNRITENVISSNRVGIYLSGSSGNTIYRNDFISNNAQTIADESPNYWNTSTGNFWSDYRGEDSNGDGAGDIPYIINSMNIDFLPAMKAFSISAQASPPPAGGGGRLKKDPLSEKHTELTPDLMVEILSYFNVRGRVYELTPAGGAAFLALPQNQMFPATGIEKIDTKLGRYAGDYGNIYTLIADMVDDAFTFSANVVIARGDIGADAYAAIAYARAGGMPLLLVKPEAVPEEVKQVIKKLGVKRIIIIGGPEAVSPEVERELSTLAQTTRIYGETRIETSIRVAQAIEGVTGKTGIVVILEGWNLKPEGAIVASLYEAPILYVRGDHLPESIEIYLRELLADGDVRVVYAGVSAQVKKRITELSAR